MTEILTDIVDGAIIELHPASIRKRWRAMRYGAGTHAAGARHGGLVSTVLGGLFIGGMTLLALAISH